MKAKHFQVGVLAKGKWHGLTWIWCKGGTFLTGHVDFFGHLTGDKVAFVYPDLKHALLGTFTKGQMAVAQFCYVSSIRFIKGHLPELTFTTPMGPIFTPDAGTRDYMCKNPMVPDPYEQNTVFVRKSKMSGGGEGLFAKIDLPSDRIISFYNGIKLTSDEIEDEKGNWEVNAYKIMDLLGKNPETGLLGVIDVPDEFISTKNYM